MTSTLPFEARKFTANNPSPSPSISPEFGHTSSWGLLLTIMCVIYVDNLDILRYSAPLYLRVTILLEGQPHNINLTLDQLRVKGVCRQRVLYLEVKPLFQVREVNLVDLVLRLESLPCHSRRFMLHQKLLWVHYLSLAMMLIFLLILSTHSFISRTFVMHIEREPELLDYGLVVSTPTEG